MTDPIERMAKAMWESQGLVLAWSELPVDAAARSICRALARAALAALVTPHLAEIEKLQAECGLRDMRLNLKDERIGDLESQVTALRAKLADAERERDALRGALDGVVEVFTQAPGEWYEGLSDNAYEALNAAADALAAYRGTP